MLTELRIIDFAIIDRLELRFEPGLNVITGETGAGKSILIDAVGLLMGGRADRDMVRASAKRAVLEATFELAGALEAAIAPVLERESLEGDEEHTLILTREVRADGRGACRVNGVTARLAVLREIGEYLVDIHGQGEHLSLLRPREHINLLDRYAELGAPRAELAGAVHRLEAVRRELKALLADEAALARRADLLQFQIDEITQATPQPGEDEALLEERNRLANAEKLTALAQEAQRALYDGDQEGASATDRLGQAAVALSRLVKIDSTMAEPAALAESLSVQAEELARTLRHYRESVEFSPARLNEVETRLQVLNTLKRKYGGSIEAVLAWAEKAQTELDTITHSEARVEALRAEEDALLHEVGAMAEKLTAARVTAAEALAAQVVAELDALRMAQTQFEVSIVQQEDPNGAYVSERRLAFDSTGVDEVEFLVSANPGEPLRPLAKVASGGEASRLMLALKTVLSRADQTPTLIFDEIDQGIGGRIGAVVGEKLWSLTAGHQVLVITHLAQLASFGDAHFRAHKQAQKGRTITTVEVLDGAARVAEIMAMLGAETESAHQNAAELLEMAERVKEDKTPAAARAGGSR
ncbi:MAG: DNA repair protein RecN [Anaerolineae bacterium]|nr:DNA repair protein RecN [Anaerolineae bacterium]